MGSAAATNIRIGLAIPDQELKVAQVDGPSKHTMDGSDISFEPFGLEPGSGVCFEVRLTAIKAGRVGVSTTLAGDSLPPFPTYTIYTNIEPKEATKDPNNGDE